MYNAPTSNGRNLDKVLHMWDGIMLVNVTTIKCYEPGCLKSWWVVYQKG